MSCITSDDLSMARPTSTEYHYITITGPVDVVPTSPGELKGKLLDVNILMGPTGSGKSAFIESLSSNVGLSISKNSLESVTQEVVCYKVVNLELKSGEKWTHILMDTPGFLDTKLSESRITMMIMRELDKLRESAELVIVNIFYCHPITDIRVGRTKRDAIRLLSAFAESFGARGINVITTMWNMVSTPKQILESDQRFGALQIDIMQKSGNANIHATKFYFNTDSALSIIEKGYGAWIHDIEKHQALDPHVKALARNNLLERIGNIQERLQLLADDKQDARIHDHENQQLMDVIRRDELAALTSLQSFLDDLYEVDPGSCSSPLHPKRQLPQISSLYSVVPVDPVETDSLAGVSPASPSLVSPVLSSTASVPRIKRILLSVLQLLKRWK